MKSVAKLLTFCINRIYSQGKSPTVQEAFTIWKLMAHFRAKAELAGGVSNSQAESTS